MEQLLNAIGLILWRFCLFSAWFVPVFRVTLINRSDENIKTLKASVVIMMILKIFWPFSKVTFIWRGD